MAKLLEVKEYDSITCNKDYINDEHFKYLDKDSFEELERLIATFDYEQNADALDFLNCTIRRNVGKVICTKNYVGLIQIKNGTQIQILPKIDTGESIDTKYTFLRMLRSMRDFPSKVFSRASLKLHNMSLYEVFINMYIQEVINLVKKGIQSSYQPIEENLNFYKGKLVIKSHIRINMVNKEHFYVKYDEFGVNRAENRLIKSTLLKLIKVSSSEENIKKIRQLLLSFNFVETSNNYEKDLSEVVINRQTKNYQNLMSWSKVFLMSKSFTAFSGDTSAKALLFPMEKVFEAYVGRNIKKILEDSNWNVSLQDKRYYLFEHRFALKPDIVIENNCDHRRIVLDTKWKSLKNNPRRNYGISQSDMYQMYAYAKKYKTNNVWLLYPINQEMKYERNIMFKSDDKVVVRLFFVDVNNIEESLEKLIKLIDKK